MTLIFCSSHSDTLRSSPAFIYSMIVIIGIGISISFGTINQLVSIFPVKFHAAFFFGCYAPFFILAPANVGLGDLCAVYMHNNSEDALVSTVAAIAASGPTPGLWNEWSENGTTALPSPLVTTFPSGHNSTAMYETRWNSVFVYYSIAVACCVFGSLAFVAALQHPVGKHSTKKKDYELQKSRNPSGATTPSAMDASLVRCSETPVFCACLWPRQPIHDA